MGEYIRGSSSLERDIEISRTLFPSKGPVSISHENQDPIRADRYLESAGASPFLIEQIFTESGEWAYTTYDLSLETSSSEKLVSTLLQSTRPVYEAAQFSLGHVNWFGYNDHGPTHIAQVVNNARDLSQQLALSGDTEKRLIVEAAGHDLGNLINRDTHSLVSPDIFERIFPDITKNVADWRIIKNAMQLHNSGVFDFYTHPTKGIWRMLPPEMKTQQIQRVFGIDGCVLLIADKIDVGRHRVNVKALNKPAIDEHQYSEINLHTRTQDFSIDTYNQSAMWAFEFNPHLDTSELIRFKDLAQADRTSESGYSVYASSHVSQPESGLPDFHKAVSQVLKKHKSAISIVAHAVFSLPTTIDTFEITFEDKSSGNNELVSIPLHRSTFVEQVEKIA